MFLIILIIVLGICWYLHSKKGIKWSHMLGAIGLGIVSIIYWAFKVDADLDKRSAITSKKLIMPQKKISYIGQLNPTI